MISSTPIKFAYQEIASVTNNFSDENVIGEGGLGKVYKGKLSQQSGESVNVVVRRIDHSFWMQDNAFDKEIGILSNLEHKNLISLVGFCDEKDEMLIVNKHVANGSLNNHLSDSTLTWMRRLKISVGVASALSYMHNHEGRNYSVIHHNVNSTSILLDENWEAKLSGFEFSMVIQEGHLDPAYERIGVGSYKSDTFSFAIVLFEILCGTKAFVSNDGDNTFQAPLAISIYERSNLHTLVDPDLYKQMDKQSFNIFADVAYRCLKERQAPPNMNQVLERLEKALKIQERYEIQEHSSTVIRNPSNQLKLKLKQLEHMRIQLKDIKLATENFSSKYRIKRAGFGMVYKTELEHVDREYCYAIKGENAREIPKKKSIVAVKSVFDTKDESGEQTFYAEIEMLTSCKHSNILTLLGFCDEGSAMILIYEYALYGSLDDYLQNSSNMTNDSWAQRMKICLQVAKGLSYLHTGDQGVRQEIVHRDIKSSNILLDKNLDAKIGDFGLCKFLNSENEEHNKRYWRQIGGTKVYIDPQYAKDGKLKKESDVYSLGVVMSEILSGTLAYDTIYNSKGLVPTARWHVENKTVQEIVDPRMKEGITEAILPSIKRLYQNSFDMFSNIAYKCLDETQANRPTLEYVIKELEEALPFQVFFNNIMRNRRGNKIQEKEPKSN